MSTTGMKLLAILTGILVVALAVFSGVQTYRLHALNIRLAALVGTPAPPPLAVPSEPPASKPAVSEEKPEPDALAKQPTPEEAAAAKAGEAFLLKERQRVKETAAIASAPAGARSLAAGGAEPAAKLSDPTDKKLGKDAKQDQQNAKRATSADSYNALRQAQTLMEKGSYDDAASTLESALKADPQNRDLYRSLGNLYERLRRYDAEIQTYSDWSKNAPDESAPHYELARAYAALGKTDESLQQLQNFLQMTQGDMNAFPMVASIYRALGMNAEEGTTLRAWAQQSPDSLDVKRTQAEYYSRTGDSQAALTTYQDIAQRLPEDADSHRNLAYAYSRLNMFGQAEAELNTAAQLQPHNLSTQLQLGDIYRQAQQFDAAAQTYQGIVAAAPDTPEAQQAQRMLADVQRQMRTAQNPK